MATQYQGWFEGFVHIGLEVICTVETAKGYFRKCGYGDTEQDNED